MQNDQTSIVSRPIRGSQPNVGTVRDLRKLHGSLGPARSSHEYHKAVNVVPAAGSATVRELHGRLHPTLKSMSKLYRTIYSLGCIFIGYHFVDGANARGPMHSDEYSRLSAACLVMAGQSNLPDVRARWLTLAKDCEDAFWNSNARDGRSKPITTRLMRAAVNLSAA
jgi:hypothetical protein